MRYTFLGDKMSDEKLRGMQCDPARDGRGKCIVGKMADRGRRGEFPMDED